MIQIVLIYVLLFVPPTCRSMLRNRIIPVGGDFWLHLLSLFGVQ